jgi:hypothetical protein
VHVDLVGRGLTPPARREAPSPFCVGFISQRSGVCTVAFIDSMQTWFWKG